MRRGRICIALVAVTALVAPCVVRAEEATDAFNSFRRFCLVDRVPVGDVIAKSESEGWKPLSSDHLAKFFKSTHLTGFSVRIKSKGGKGEFLALGDAPALGDPKLFAHVCVLIAQPVNTDGVTAEAASWVGGQTATLPHAGLVVLGFTSDTQGRHRVRDINGAAAKQLLREGKLKVIIVQAQGDQIQLGYFLPFLSGGADKTH